MNLSLLQLEALAKLAERHEYAVLVAWLDDERGKRVREALHTANPQACGAAALLQDLTDTLANVRELYNQARNTAKGSGPSY
jgi:predicted LPLAT superfamily acyltransferase